MTESDLILDLTASKLRLGLNDISSDDYHADRTFLSSSVLKTIHQDLSAYYDQYILGNKKEFSASSVSAMAEGSLAHSMILEPHTVDAEFAFFPDWTKRGPAFEAFVAANPGKKIISLPQRERVEQLVAAFRKHPVAPALHEGGVAEQSLCVIMDDVPIKVRFDYLNVEKGYIADIKTTGMAADPESFKLTCNQLSYNLSAALYCRAAEQHFGKPFSFLFVVLGKKDNSCHVYRAGPHMIASGNRMVTEALTKFKVAKATGVWVEADKAEETVSEYIIEI